MSAVGGEKVKVKVKVKDHRRGRRCRHPSEEDLCATTVRRQGTLQGIAPNRTAVAGGNHRRLGNGSQEEEVRLLDSSITNTSHPRERGRGGG